MQIRFIVVAACAALAIGARGYAGDDHQGATSASAQAGDSQATQQGTSPGQAQQPGTGANADPAMQPTEAERQAGGAIGRQPGETKSVIGTVEKVERNSLTLRTGPEGETQELSVDDGTQFTSEGLAVSRDNIAAGDEVRASFQGDSMLATEVHVMSRGASQQGEQGSPTATPPAQQGSGAMSPPSEPAGTERGQSDPAHPERSGQR
jgi:hypothetical protein